MSDIILHHYAGSPFSEKVRLLLGYKKQAYKAVDIPVIMPKPDFIPLTGGYRKTPAMQLGADIFCDTAIMCRVIDRMFPENSIYPQQHEAMLAAAAHWTDTFFFKISVAKVFQPKVLANHPLFSDSAAAAAFTADRAQLNKGAISEPIETSQAEAYWLSHMTRLDQQLQHSTFLFGDKPTIADFSTYHCLWFAYSNDVLRNDFTAFQQVLRWYQDMTAFGHGDISNISGTDALEIAKNCEPLAEEKLTSTSRKSVV